MNLNLIDQLTLLALDDKKGTFIADSTSYSYAIAGAVIMELALEERIDLSGEKVIVKDTSKTGDTIIDTHFELIIGSVKERKVRSWVDRIGNKADKIKGPLLTNSLKIGYWKKRRTRFCGYFPIINIPLKIRDRRINLEAGYTILW